jgi:hypothetical protein
MLAPSEVFVEGPPVLAMLAPSLVFVLGPPELKARLRSEAAVVPTLGPPVVRPRSAAPVFTQPALVWLA